MKFSLCSMSKNYKQALLLFTTIAFLVSALLPFYAIYNVDSFISRLESNQEKTTFLTEIGGDTVLICTASGFRLVSLADLQSQKENPEEHPKYQCGICYVAQYNKNYDTSIASFSDIKYRSTNEQVVRWGVEQLAHKRSYIIAYLQSRAPPSFVKA